VPQTEYREHILSRIRWLRGLACATLQKGMRTHSSKRMNASLASMCHEQTLPQYVGHIRWPTNVFSCKNFASYARSLVLLLEYVFLLKCVRLLECVLLRASPCSPSRWLRCGWCGVMCPPLKCAGRCCSSSRVNIWFRV